MKKKELYRLAPITFITCSQWLKNRASQSALLDGHTIIYIPNPINTQLFKPQNMIEARNKIGLPTDKKLILFGSIKVTDKRKGIDYFVESCKLLAERYPELKEELGVEADIAEIGHFVYRHTFKNGLTEYEYDHVLLGSIPHSTPIVPDPSEADAVQWMSPEELTRQLTELPQIFTPWFLTATPIVLDHLNQK
jgi:glycosyltransferase involved in cell wall biosynthesis